MPAGGHDDRTEQQIRAHDGHRCAVDVDGPGRLHELGRDRERDDEQHGAFAFDDDGPGGWWILPEMMVRFGPHDAVSPDLAGWRRDRLHLPTLEDGVAIDVIPDWICEILSPSTASVDRARKLPIYHREGVCHAWVIDPLERTLEVFHRSRRGWQLAESHAGKSVVHATPFESVALELSALWLPGSEIAYVP